MLGVILNMAFLPLIAYVNCDICFSEIVAVIVGILMLSKKMEIAYIFIATL